MLAWLAPRATAWTRPEFLIIPGCRHRHTANPPFGRWRGGEREEGGREADYYFRTYDGVLCSVTIRHLDVIDTGWSPVLRFVDTVNRNCFVATLFTSPFSLSLSRFFFFLEREETFPSFFFFSFCLLLLFDCYLTALSLGYSTLSIYIYIFLFFQLNHFNLLFIINNT